MRYLLPLVLACACGPAIPAQLEELGPSPQEIVDSAVLTVTPEDGRFPAPDMTGRAIVSVDQDVDVEVQLLGVQAFRDGAWGPAHEADYWSSTSMFSDGRTQTVVSAFKPLRYTFAARAVLGDARGPVLMKPFCVGD